MQLVASIKSVAPAPPPLVVAAKQKQSVKLHPVSTTLSPVKAPPSNSAEHPRKVQLVKNDVEK